LSNFVFTAADAEQTGRSMTLPERLPSQPVAPESTDTRTTAPNTPQHVRFSF